MQLAVGLTLPQIDDVANLTADAHELIVRWDVLFLNLLVKFFLGRPRTLHVTDQCSRKDLIEPFPRTRPVGDSWMKEDGYSLLERILIVRGDHGLRGQSGRSSRNNCGVSGVHGPGGVGNNRTIIEQRRHLRVRDVGRKGHVEFVRDRPGNLLIELSPALGYRSVDRDFSVEGRQGAFWFRFDRLQASISDVIRGKRSMSTLSTRRREGSKQCAYGVGRCTHRSGSLAIDYGDERAVHIKDRGLLSSRQRIGISSLRHLVISAPIRVCEDVLLIGILVTVGLETIDVTFRRRVCQLLIGWHIGGLDSERRIHVTVS